jgi:hypothetical protein
MGFLPALRISFEFGFWMYLHTHTLCTMGSAWADVPVARTNTPVVANAADVMIETARRRMPMVVVMCFP